MRVIEREDAPNTYDITIRQSWLKDAIVCNERGRHGIVRGNWNMPNELTAFGTGAHAGFELKLNNPNATHDDMLDAAMAAFDEIADGGTMRWVRLQRYQIAPKMADAVTNWMEGIYPHIEGDVLGVEHNFTYPLETIEVDGKTLHIAGTGTIDLVTSTQMWDWKTASRKYSPKEKQKQDVQSTMYAGAAVAAGWASWPCTFQFGVVMRDGGHQIVPVERDESHLNWLKRTIRPFVRNYFNIGTDEEWAMNDTGFLCSENWCPFWSVCRGCHSQ